MRVMLGFPTGTLSFEIYPFRWMGAHLYVLPNCRYSVTKDVVEGTPLFLENLFQCACWVFDKKEILFPNGLYCNCNITLRQWRWVEFHHPSIHHGGMWNVASQGMPVNSMSLFFHGFIQLYWPAWRLYFNRWDMKSWYAPESGISKPLLSSGCCVEIDRRCWVGIISSTRPLFFALKTHLFVYFKGCGSTFIVGFCSMSIYTKTQSHPPIINIRGKFLAKIPWKRGIATSSIGGMYDDICEIFCTGNLNGNALFCGSGRMSGYEVAPSCTMFIW